MGLTEFYSTPHLRPWKGNYNSFCPFGTGVLNVLGLKYLLLVTN